MLSKGEMQKIMKESIALQHYIIGRKLEVEQGVTLLLITALGFAKKYGATYEDVENTLKENWKNILVK